MDVCPARPDDIGGSIWDPVANLIASARYIRAVYGSPYNIPGIGNNAAYGGYDSGGWLEPGLTLAVNKTGQREAVLNPAQSQALIQGGPGTEARLDRLIDLAGQNASLTRALIKAIERSAPAADTAMADALNGAARKSAYKSAYSARG